MIALSFNATEKRFQTVFVDYTEDEIREAFLLRDGEYIKK